MAQLYHLDPALIREHIKQKNYDYLGLATEANLGTRIVTQVLGKRGSSVVSRRTAMRLAKALDVDVDEITVGWLSPWHETPDIGKSKYTDILRRAIRHDMRGEHARAVLECERVLKELKEDHLAYPLVVVKKVTFLANDGKHMKALAILEDLRERHPDARAWATYHMGIALRRLGRFDEARAEFEELRRHKNPFQTSILHQLGAVDLEEAKRSKGSRREELLESAERLLNDSLSAWAAFGRTHRKGFALQRLGELAALRGQLDVAFSYYRDALTIFAWERCERYVEGVQRDLAKLWKIATATSPTPPPRRRGRNPPLSAEQPFH